MRIAIGLAVIAVLAGCAKTSAPDRPGSVVSVPRPSPPLGAAPGLSVPQPGADGRYTTINSGVGGQEALWHVRAALNVAALSCRGDASLSKNYNSFLSSRKTVLNAAYRDESSRLGVAALDTHSTRLYNFFAQPNVQPEFCRIAVQEATQAIAIAPAALPAHATAALGRLEAPFLSFFNSYNRYQRDYALWQASPNKAGAVAALSSARTARMPTLMAVAPSASEATIDSWRIQIGAFTGRAAAEAAWAKARAEAPGLARYKPHYEAVPDRPELVRLQIGSETDRDGAIRLCATAAAAGFDCIPAPQR